jgi:hypothetical protein
MSWLDARVAEEFGVALARFYMSRMPATSDKANQDGQLRKVVEKMVERMDQFKADHTLNVYQRAKLWNAFKWALIDAGYDRSFAGDLTRELVSSF